MKVLIITGHDEMYEGTASSIIGVVQQGEGDREAALRLVFNEMQKLEDGGKAGEWVEINPTCWEAKSKTAYALRHRIDINGFDVTIPTSPKFRGMKDGLFRCGHKAEAPHSCPYAEDIKGDSSISCTCCGDCQSVCAADC